MVEIVAFGPAAIFYLFGVFNTWSRLPFFQPPPRPPRHPSIVEIAVRPTTHLLHPADSRRLPKGQSNGQEAAGANGDEFGGGPFQLELSACDDSTAGIGKEAEALWFEWKVLHPNGSVELFKVTNDCSLQVEVEKEGSYFWSVEIFPNPPLLKSRSTTRPFFTGHRQLHLVDYWLVAVGDSFASGEGNPDTPLTTPFYLKASQQQWLSPRCHRSRSSWAYKVYERLAGMIPSSATTRLRFSYLACVGSKIEGGLLGDQLDRVAEMASRRGSRGPDLLLMSVGGNDIDYSEVLFQLLNQATLRRGRRAGLAAKRKRELPLFSSLEMRFFYASHQLDRLGDFVAERIRPKQTLVTHYFDISRNQFGQVDSNCSELAGVTSEDWRLAEKLILRRLNQLISEKAAKFEWTVLDEVPLLFGKGGICSRGGARLIRSMGESIRMQGDVMGAFHPVEEGHRRVAQVAINKIDFRRLLKIAD